MPDMPKFTSGVSQVALHDIADEVPGEFVSAEKLDDAIDAFDEFIFFLSSHPAMVARRSELTESQAEVFLFEMRKRVNQRIENPNLGIAA